MRTVKKITPWLVGVLFVLAAALLLAMEPDYRVARASQGMQAEKKRQKEILVDYTRYEWWILRWKTNEIICQVYLNHEGLPNADEVYDNCSYSAYYEWFYTQPCKAAEQGLNVNDCSGVYMHLSRVSQAQRKVIIELPLPKVWLTLNGCSDLANPSRCNRLPALVLTGEETLPNEMVVRINGVFNGAPFSCQGDQCSIPLHSTGIQGAAMEFWAESSYGDASPVFTARVRVQPWGDFMAPERITNTEQLWFVDVISDQWLGDKPASCADTWQVFPEVGGPPAWLTSPRQPDDLKTSVSYAYLAGMLIRNRVVNARTCRDGGMLSDTIASACGVSAAQNALLEWQNRFNAEIMQVAADTGVPSQLMKNIFARESQLWPGIYQTYQEAGLGQLTENGADTVLLWNPTFYNQFCPLVLNKATCKKGWGNLTVNEKNLLRGGLVRKVNASCKDCPMGIDISQANFSVTIFANSLLANCEQVGRIISNSTQRYPGQTSSYSDLWRFTLVNYNAGSGCLANAVQRTVANNQKLDWENVSRNLEAHCQKAVRYVEDITQVSRPTPTPSPTINPGGASPAQRTASPITTQAPTAAATRTPIPTVTPALPPSATTLVPTQNPTPAAPPPPPIADPATRVP